MNKIIITGHGNFASGIYSSLELISGPKENVLVVDFLKEDSDDLLRENIKQLINDDDNYLVICDLLGGSPYKQAALLSCEHKNIRVVTGANVGGILDVSLKLNKLTIDELAERVVEASLKNLQLVNLEIDNKQEEVTDGI